MRSHHKFWPRRLPHSLTVPSTSLWDNLAISAQRYPDKVALVFFGRTLTYRQLKESAERLAAYLATLGVKRGDRVALCMQNCPQLVMAHFAILRANAVVVPVNPMNRAEELKHYITDPDTKIAITTGDLAAEWVQASDALPPAERLVHLVVTQFTDAFDANVSGDDAPPLRGQTGWARATLACAAARAGPCLERCHRLHQRTARPGGGAAGLGFVALHQRHHRAAQGVYAPAQKHHAQRGGQCALGAGSADNVTLAVVPMFHITGMVSVMHASIYSAATIVIMPRWDRDLAGRLISRWQVTNWTNIPTMVIDLLASPHFASYDLSSLVYIGGGGAAMPQAVAQRLLEQYGLRYAEGYGLTETAAPSHSNPPDNPKQQCLGIPS